MGRPIYMLALDCGSTTTSALVAAAQLTESALGRMEITHVEPVFRSDMLFTPFTGKQIDAPRLEQLLDGWLTEAAFDPRDVFGGGALVTGLAAQRENAAAITQLVETRLAEAVVATADDPRLESWLAFMGNCHALSKAMPDQPILNLDIGGGTTNLALGIDGQVTSTGCLFVGARHFQFEPGTYRLTALSPLAAELLAHLQMTSTVGDTLSTEEIDSILDFYLAIITSAIGGDPTAIESSIGRRMIQANFDHRAGETEPLLTLSGGVGQLAYHYQSGACPTGPTEFGDLGGELAMRILRSPLIARRLLSVTPPGLGRATLLGLLRHSTQVSGSTIHLPNPQSLPLKNTPLVGRITPDATDQQISHLLDLAARGTTGGCMALEIDRQDLNTVRGLGQRLANLLQTQKFPRDRALVVLLPANLAKVLGQYMTGWGTLDVNLIVIDEVSAHEAQFVRVGRMRDGVVPLWLYGM